VRVNDLVLVQGMKDSRTALERWQGAPLRVLGPWLGVSALITMGLLLAILAIASLAEPDATRFALPGLTAPATGADYLHVLYRNSLVLALHAMACLAGFIAGSSLPLQLAAASTGGSTRRPDGWRSGSWSVQPRSRSSRRRS
jgi:hypothetical protein